MMNAIERWVDNGGGMRRVNLKDIVMKKIDYEEEEVENLGVEEWESYVTELEVRKEEEWGLKGRVGG